MNVPNTITFGRILLALITFWLILHTQFYLLSFVLTLLVIFGDFLDGYFARKLKQETKLGAWLDIAGDRFVELAYWAVFTSLNIISPWILIIFLLRGIFVDGIRAFAQQQGMTAFGQSSMMKSPLGVFIVSSRFSRFSYAVVKALTFALLALSLEYNNILGIAQLGAWISTVYCVLRGLPVLIEGKSLINAE